MTPLRGRDAALVDGCLMLSDPELGYEDGAERDLLDIVRSATDLSSLSDELESRATSWAERYHLSKSRANVVRPFQITGDMAVLEIGAGCGAVTRWLGETGATVDALEPMLPRARVLRERTRDLENVSVFVGLLDDVPAEAAYDVVVVIGVLEYVGAGTADPGPYRRFLAQVGTVLRPGGTLLLAIENRLGVKYFAGSPEDHTGRIFDSLEGYPHGGRARTFSRTELVELLTDSGLVPSVLGAFPDYKLPRLLMAEDLYESAAADLAVHLPQFPSPEWSLPRPNLADEALLWRTFGQARLFPQVPNSFVVAATRGETSRPLWPFRRLATYFATQRRARYTMQADVEQTEVDQTDVEQHVGDVLVRHRRLLPALQEPGDGDRDDGWLTHRDVTDPFVPGVSVPDLVRAGEDEQVSAALRRWVELLDEAIAGTGPGVPVDLIPTNLLVRGDGEVVPIDQEWWSTRHTRDAVLARGLLMTAYQASELPRDRPWAEETVLDLARRLAVQAGVDPGVLDPGRWHAPEVEFARHVQGTEIAPVLAAMAARLVNALPERDMDVLPRLRAADAELRAALEAARSGWEESAAAVRDVEAQHHELAERYRDLEVRLQEVTTERDRLASRLLPRVGRAVASRAGEAAARLTSGRAGRQRD